MSYQQLTFVERRIVRKHSVNPGKSCLACQDKASDKLPSLTSLVFWDRGPFNCCLTKAGAPEDRTLEVVLKKPLTTKIRRGILDLVSNSYYYQEAILNNSENCLRVTEQRRIILEELKKVKSHPTANEIYDMVRKRLPKISLGTVYRNLEILSEAGLIQKLELAGTQKRFDGIVENHCHVRCLGCGRVEDISVDPIPAIDAALKGQSGYKILWHRLEFIGLCPRCQSETLEGLLGANTYAPDSEDLQQSEQTGDSINRKPFC